MNITCRRLRELGRDLRKFEELTTAERAPVFRHVCHCKSCVIWLRKNGERDNGNMKSLARKDFEDPEFIEAIQ